MYTARAPDGRYGAVQVVGCPSKDEAEIVTFGALFPEAPTIEEALSMPLLEDDLDGDVQVDRQRVPARVPWWVERVGAAEPVRTFDSQRRSSRSGAWSLLGAYDRETQAEHEIDPWRYDAGEIEVDVGGGAASLRADSWHVLVGKGRELQPSEAGRVRFRALDALPRLHSVDYLGDDPAIIDYAVRRRLVSLAWRGGTTNTIDLSASQLFELTLEVPDRATVLRVPEGLTTLTLSGAIENLVVEGACTDLPFELTIESPQILPPPRGLENALKAAYTGVTDSDTSGLAAYSRLTELRIWGGPGVVRDATGLAKLDKLRELALYDLYDVDAAAWPDDWPHLDGAVIFGLRKSEAAKVKASLATVPDVTVRQVRSDAWIEDNLNNPFRDWDTDGATLAKKARAAWKKAKRAAAKADSEEDAHAVLATLVEALNAIALRYDLDTVRREEAHAAFLSLARDLGIPEDRAGTWFDDLRDF